MTVSSNAGKGARWGLEAHGWVALLHRPCREPRFHRYTCHSSATRGFRYLFLGPGKPLVWCRNPDRRVMGPGLGLGSRWGEPTCFGLEVRPERSVRFAPAAMLGVVHCVMNRNGFFQRLWDDFVG